MNDTINTFLNNFHFIRPLWLFAILALIMAVALLKRLNQNQSPWQRFLPPHLTKALLDNSQKSQTNKNQHIPLLLKPFTIGLLTIIALAGPTWKKLPQPVYQIEKGAVLIMDMSYSMYANDLKPNRLTRARYKAIDLLANINEGDIGLIAYAGDAFIISPLTKDIKNIELLLPSLTPEIMPVLGSNPLAALSLAHEMLINAGHLDGDIYWFTDGIDNEDLIDIHDWSNDFGHKLNILGVGTTNGAPIKLPSGELLKDDNGRIVVPKLYQQRLAAAALRSQGKYQTITNNANDIETLTTYDTEGLTQSNQTKNKNKSQTGDQWEEQGPWLIFIILPLLLTYFRRGTALLLMPFISFLTLFPSLFLSTPSYANDEIKTEIKKESSTTAQNLWNNLWLTKDQQGQEKFNQNQFENAAITFENPLWQGSSHYKAGNYQQALDSFKQSNTSEALYNQGNALAQLQQYKEAIKAYKKALKIDPELQDAKENIAKIEELQKQQDKKDSNDKNKDKNEEQKNKEDQEQQGDQQQNDQSGDQNKESDQQKENGSNGEQSQDKNNQDEQKQQDSKKQNSNDSDKEKKQDQQQKESNGEKNEQKSDEKSLAQISDDKKNQETQQKHQQLLNKVTDDPYLLLRNKMQLEYQKRKQENNRQGAQKKW